MKCQLQRHFQSHFSVLENLNLMVGTHVKFSLLKFCKQGIRNSDRYGILKVNFHGDHVMAHVPEPV